MLVLQTMLKPTHWKLIAVATSTLEVRTFLIKLRLTYLLTRRRSQKS